MTSNEFKKTGRLLREVYKELEAEALKDNVDIFSEDYSKVQGIVREKVLGKLGFTIEEYREAKEKVAPVKKTDISGLEEKINALNNNTELQRPTTA